MPLPVMVPTVSDPDKAFTVLRFVQAIPARGDVSGITDLIPVDVSANEKGRFVTGPYVFSLFSSKIPLLRISSLLSLL